MLEPYDDHDEFYAEIEVKNPRVENGSYISYEIAVETNNLSFNEAKSAVRRRYSEFVILRKLLLKEFPAWKVPSLPPKFPFKDHFSNAFVEKRRKGLEEFITKLVSQKIFLSSKALHLFLQSQLSMSEVQNIVQGKSSVLPNNCTLIDEGFVNSAHASLVDDMSTLSLSSHTEDTKESFQNSVSDSCSSTDTTYHSPAGSKRFLLYSMLVGASWNFERHDTDFIDQNMTDIRNLEMIITGRILKFSMDHL